MDRAFFELERDSDIPLYQQVKNKVMNEISRGSVSFDGKLLSERSLARIFKINRATARRASHPKGFTEKSIGTYAVGCRPGSKSHWPIFSCRTWLTVAHLEITVISSNFPILTFSSVTADTSSTRSFPGTERATHSAN